MAPLKVVGVGGCVQCSEGSDQYGVDREGASCEEKGNACPLLRELAVTEKRLTLRDLHENFYEG